MFTKFREKPLEAQSLLSKVAHQRLIKRDFILELFVWILRNCLETLLQTPDKDYKNWLKYKIKYTMSIHKNKTIQRRIKQTNNTK